MLLDLFSIFDYQVYVSLSINIKYIFAFWALSLAVPSMLYSSGEWARGSTLWYFLGHPLSCWAWQETRMSVRDVGGSLLIISACLWVTLVVLWQAVPGVFVSVAHLSVTGCVALPFWGGIVLASSLTCSSLFFSSLVPIGCPNYLVPVLILVEIFSHFMRPIALCARLSLTMITGHIILGLVWGMSSEVLFSMENLYPYSLEWEDYSFWVHYYPISSILCAGVVMGLNIGLVLVEVGIGFLQAYIFFTLLLFFSTQYPRFDGSCIAWGNSQDCIL